MFTKKQISTTTGFLIIVFFLIIASLIVFFNTLEDFYRGRFLKEEKELISTEKSFMIILLIKK